MTSEAGTRFRRLIPLPESLVWVFIIPLALFLILWSMTRPSINEDQLKGDHAPACEGCTFTVGDRRAAAGVTPQAADDMTLNLTDMPQGFELIDDHELTPQTQGDTDAERLASAGQGFITGRNRAFRRPTPHGTAEVRVHLTIYVSSSGASWAENTNAAYRPDAGWRIIPVLSEITLGDESSIFVIESRAHPDAVEAVAIFRSGNTASVLSQSSPRMDFDARQFIAVAYAQLAKIEARNR